MVGALPFAARTFIQEHGEASRQCAPPAFFPSSPSPSPFPAPAPSGRRRTILRENYERFAVGSIPPGVVGAEKGASIAVGDTTAAEGAKSLRFVDAPGLDKSFHPFREVRLAGRRIVRSGKVSLSFDVQNDPKIPAAFYVELRDWSKGEFRALPSLSFGADGSLALNGKPTDAKLAPGAWHHVLVEFAVGPEVAEKTYQVALTPAGGQTTKFEGTYAKDAQAITWVGVVTQNDKQAEFAMDNLELTNERETTPEPPHEIYTDYLARGDLMRSHARFAAGGPARVAFMGGSVTTRQWRLPLMESLAERFPGTDFDFVMAGIGGTDANLGAFRLPEHVFGRGKVDLLFLEFAVNGGGVRAMEGIVRQARRLNPDIDIVILYFASTGHSASFAAGKVPAIVQEHERVAEHYGISSLWLYREIARRVQEGKIKWEDFASDSVQSPPGRLRHVHPVHPGLPRRRLAGRQPASPGPPPPLPERLDPLCYENGRFLALDEAAATGGFERHRTWSVKPTCNFAPPADVLACTEPGSELRLEFGGRAIGIYTIVGMDAGTLEFSIDGQPFRKADLFDHYCPRFHRPQHKILADDLAPGPHTLTLRSAPERNAKSEGHAIRILKFMAN